MSKPSEALGVFNNRGVYTSDTFASFNTNCS